jgi:hypothetical protein
MPLVLPRIALAFALSFPTLATAASLDIGPAVPIAEPAERIGAFHPQNEPSIAWNGDAGLVVWVGKAGAKDLLLANHVDTTGRPLEGAPLILASTSPVIRPRVAALGSHFLVIWHEVIPGEAGTRGVLVERNGAIRQLGRFADYPFYPSDIASNGSTAIIVGSSGEPDYAVRILWIDAEARVIASRTIGTNAMAMLAASDGTSFDVVWHELKCATYTCDHDFYLLHARADGSSDAPVALLKGDDVGVFDYALAGFEVARDRMLVLFSERLGVMTGRLYDRTGNIAAQPFPIEDSGSSGILPAVSTDGQSFVAAYAHVIFNGPARPIRSTRLRRIGTTSASDSITLLNDTRSVALQWTGQAYVMAETGGEVLFLENHNVTATGLDRTGAPVDGAPRHILSRAPNQQDAPAAASDGTIVLAAWEEFFPAAGLWKVKYGRTDASGTPLDGRGREIAASAAIQRNPRVVFDGARFLVLWVETAGTKSEIRARRLHRDGSPAGDTFTVAASFCAARFDAAAQRDSVLVSHLGSGCDSYRARDVIVTTVEPGDSTSSVVIAETIAAEAPIIAASDASALVVWQQDLARVASDPCPIQYEFCPTKQVLNGAVIENGAVRGVTIVEGSMMINREPQIAWNGRHYLVTWLGAADFDRTSGLYVRLFSKDAEAASDTALLANDTPPTFSSLRRGSVTASSSGFVVAWQRSPMSNVLSTWRVASNGTPVHGAEQVVEKDVTDIRSPQLIQGPRSSSLLLYSLSGPDNVYLGHNRVVMRSLVEVAGRTRAVGR